MATSVAAPTRMTATPPKAKRGGGNLIGIASGKNHIVAWYYLDGLRITVTADHVPATNFWTITGWYGDKMRITATVFGGRWATDCYVKFLRNAMASRSNRTHGIKKNPPSAAARSATAKEA
jgi:hypothetical protein